MLNNITINNYFYPRFLLSIVKIVDKMAVEMSGYDPIR